MKYLNLREEELKIRVADEYFDKYDCANIISNIDFSVRLKQNISTDSGYLLWAEVKNKPTDITTMFAQLILTIGKARTFDKLIPPPYLACFDTEKIAFIEYSELNELFYITDFNWNVTPSNKNTKEYKQISDLVGVRDSVVGIRTPNA